MLVTEIHPRYAVQDGEVLRHYATHEEATECATRVGGAEIHERYRATYADSTLGTIEFSPLCETREQASGWLERRKAEVPQMKTGRCHFCGLPLNGGQCEECGQQF